ncbi:MAG: hypothetical protein LBE82_09850 [Chitinophagaceae bacterium]|nr:hypothetical protein [Chitinophagaceae bacterium]
MKSCILSFLMLLVLAVSSYGQSNKFITLNGRRINAIDNDSTLSATDSTRIPTQRAVYKFIKNNGGGSTVLGNGIFYVSKKYTGAGSAVITGLTLASVSSTQNSYTQQLNSAVMGNPGQPYPDPFSARNAALDKIAAGNITSATIVVLENQQWYIGSDNSTKNGSWDGSTTSGGVADVGFSQANGITAVASLAQNKVNYYFGVNSGLYYINSGYPIYAIYNADANDNVFISNISGHGFFKQYFGEVQGMASSATQGLFATLFWVDNARASIAFEADEIWLQQNIGITFYSYKSVNIKVKKVISPDNMVVRITSNTRNGDGSPSNLFVDMDEVQVSNNLYPIGIHPTDWWYFIVITANGLDITGAKGLSSSRTKNISLNFGNMYLNGGAVGTKLLTFANTTGITTYCRNMNFISNIKNLYVANPGNGVSCLLATAVSAGDFINNNWTVNVDHYIGTAPFLGQFAVPAGSASSNNHLNINMGTAIRRVVPEENAQSTDPFFDISSGGASNNAPPVNVKITVGLLQDYLGNPLGFKYATKSGNNLFLNGTFASMGSQAALQLPNGVTDYSNIYLNNCTLISPTGVVPLQNAGSSNVTVNASGLTLSNGAPSNVTVAGQAPIVIPALANMVH